MCEDTEKPEYLITSIKAVDCGKAFIPYKHDKFLSYSQVIFSH